MCSKSDNEITTKTPTVVAAAAPATKIVHNNGTKRSKRKKSVTHEIGLRIKLGKRAKWNGKTEIIPGKITRRCM